MRKGKSRKQNQPLSLYLSLSLSLCISLSLSLRGLFTAITINYGMEVGCKSIEISHLTRVVEITAMTNVSDHYDITIMNETKVRLADDLIQDVTDLRCVTRMTSPCPRGNKMISPQ